MKPWWKKMTIIACCILCAGVVLSGIGWALGGEIVTLGDSLPDRSAATVQRVLGRIEDAVQIDVLDRVDDEVQDSLQQAREEVESAMQRADDAVQKTMNISGTVLPLTLSDEQSQPLSGDITSVRINVGADRMKILPGESWALSYQLFFPEDLSYEVENGQLTLSYGWEKGRYYRPDGSEHITLTVPEDAVLQGVTVEELGRLLYTTGLHLGKVQVESEDVDVQIESSVLDDVVLEAADARLRIEDSQLKALELDTLDLELNLNNLTADSISVDSTDSDATLRNVTVQGEAAFNTTDLEMEAGSLTAGALNQCQRRQLHCPERQHFGHDADYRGRPRHPVCGQRRRKHPDRQLGRRRGAFAGRQRAVLQPRLLRRRGQRGGGGRSGSCASGWPVPQR